MSLTKSEFDLLNYFRETRNITQRDMADKFSMSLGKVNKLVTDLKSKELINNTDAVYDITERGMDALKPYKVNNAIIMAAGMSSRFAPLSYERPKGLLNVKGEILIEREIRQLQEAGITDITIVVGYMKEKFFYLEEKFGAKIVVNEDYYQYNNTSTLIRVLDKLSNTYICSSDNYFVDNVFEPYVYQGYYSAVYAAGETDEYCLKCDSHGRITDVTVGGSNAWYMLGHVYFDKEFSDKFTAILRTEYEKPETKNGLWEDLYAKHLKELALYIRKYDADKVREFDSLEELRDFDEEYINNADSTILKNICKILKCEMKDIVNVKAIKAGLTNTSFQFEIGSQGYVYRHPGNGTSKYINRMSEAFSMKVAAELGLDDTFIYMDENEGWKISKFIKNARQLDYNNRAEVDMALKMMRMLHDKKIVSKYDFGIWQKTEEFIKRLDEIGKSDFEDFKELYNTMSELKDVVMKDDNAVKCLCHNDCYSPNFLLDEDNKMYLIDWEYSGNDDPASDLGTFICCSEYTYDEAVEIIKQYLGKEPSEQELAHYIGYVAIAAYYWYVWALYQETRGNAVGEWLYMWYKSSKLYCKEAMKLYNR